GSNRSDGPISIRSIALDPDNLGFIAVPNVRPRRCILEGFRQLRARRDRAAQLDGRQPAAMKTGPASVNE
ncbi:unnamed protein product, partial [marine sediment metagenome]